MFFSSQVCSIYREYTGLEGFTLDNIPLFPPCKSASRDQTSVLEYASTKCFTQNFFNAIEGSCYSVVAFSRRIPKYYTISKISTNQTRELDCEVANQVLDLVFNFSGKVAMVSMVKKKK